MGSIGPMRQRCLARLRRSPHLAAIADLQDEDIRKKQARGDRGD
jgi:hypothetical protein